MRHQLIAKALLVTSNKDHFFSINGNTIRCNSFEFKDIEKALTSYHFSGFKVHNMVRMERENNTIKMTVNIK